MRAWTWRENTTIFGYNEERRLTYRTTVKYHSFLRKMTRFNPTRGGKLLPLDMRYGDLVGCSTERIPFQVPSTSVLPPVSSTRLSAAWFPTRPPVVPLLWSASRCSRVFLPRMTRRSASSFPRLSVCSASALAASTAPLAV